MRKRNREHLGQRQWERIKEHIKGVFTQPLSFRGLRVLCKN